MTEVNVKLSGAESCKTALTKGNTFITDAISLTSGGFNALCNNPDLASGYVQQYLEALNACLDLSQSHVITALDAYISTLEQPVEPPEEEGDDPKDPGGDGPTGPGGGGGPSTPEEEQGGKIIDPSAMDDMTLPEVKSLVDTMEQLADQKGKPIDTMLEDETLADDIKKIFMECSFLPDSLKKQFADADSQVVRETLLSIMRGESPEIFDLNPLNVGAIYRILLKAAEENGITVEQLLCDDKYLNVLRQTLGSFEEVVDTLVTWEDLPSTEYQQNCLKVFDGDDSGASPTTTNALRTFVGYISEQTSIPAEDLLQDSAYADTLKLACQEFGKSCAFMEACSKYSDKGMQTYAGNLFNGKNQAALGMSADNVKSFRAEVDALAKSKGVSTKDLLSKSDYAKDVSGLLNSSSNTKDIGAIYSSREETVSQSVAKNIYSTEYKTTKILAEQSEAMTGSVKADRKS